MRTSSWERFAPLTGVVFVALTVAGIVLTLSGSPDDFPAAVDEIVTYYTEETDAIMIGGWLGLLGSFFLIWFAGSVRARLRDAGQERLGTVAFGGGVAAAAMGLLIDGTNVMAAMRADEEEIDPQVATVMYDIATGTIGTGLPFAIAVFIAATSVVAFRTGALPKWLGAFGVIVVIGLLIPPIAWAVTGLALLWALVTSIVLFTTQDRAAAVAAPPPPAV